MTRTIGEIAKLVHGAQPHVPLIATYPGRKAVAANLAFPFSPSDLEAGDAYELNVPHLVTVDDPLELFPIEIVEA